MFRILAATCVISLYCSISVSALGELIPPGFYRITSALDGTALTATDLFLNVPGREFRLSTVITSEWKGYAEQEWKVENSPLAVPEQYSLTSRRFSRNKVAMWAPEKFYEVPIEWRITYLGGDKWQLQNKDTEKCLTNWGPDRDVDEWRCDKYARNQQWYIKRLFAVGSERVCP